MAVGPRHLLGVAAVLLAANVALAIAQRPDAFGGSREHPAIQYNTAPNTNAITEPNTKLEDLRVTFTFDPASGCLRSALDALDGRLMTYPLSYTIYSPAIRQAIGEILKNTLPGF